MEIGINFEAKARSKLPRVGAMQMAVEFRPAGPPTFNLPGRQGLYSLAG